MKRFSKYEWVLMISKLFDSKISWLLTISQNKLTGISSNTKDSFPSWKGRRNVIFIWNSYLNKKVCKWSLSHTRIFMNFLRDGSNYKTKIIRRRYITCIDIRENLILKHSILFKNNYSWRSKSDAFLVPLNS